MSKDSNEQIVSAATAATNGLQKIVNRVRVYLDELTDEVQKNGGMPYGMTLEARITEDRFGNKGMYVFLSLDGELFPGRDLRWNGSTVTVPELKDGKWITLNRPLDNPGWEARDLVQAVKHYRAGILTHEAARNAYNAKQEADRQARAAKTDA